MAQTALEQIRAVQLAAAESGEAALAALPNELAGIIGVPDLELELPVWNECTPELLKQAPCLFSGEAQGKNPQRVIIAGHDYKTHFGEIPNLQAGAEVVFTDRAGNVTHYRVEYLDRIGGKDRPVLESGEWDLTLFTCTYDGLGRIIVRCRKAYGG